MVDLFCAYSTPPTPSDTQQELINQAMEAIIDGNIERLKLLLPQLEQGVDSRESDGSSLLLCAAQCNRLTIAKMLLQAGANVELHSRQYTPLFVASEQGYAEMSALLLEYGAQPLGEFQEETPASIATYKQDPDTTAVLQQGISNFNIKDVRRRVPIIDPANVSQVPAMFDPDTPPTYRVCFRGLHGVSDALRESKLNRPHGSKAVMDYSLRETERRAIEQEIRKSCTTEETKRRKRQQEYTNTYRYPEHPLAKGNPMFSTTSDPRSALLYAFGYKMPKILQDSRLALAYLPDGKPLNQYIGVMYAYVFTKEEYLNLDPFSVLQSYAAGEIDTNYRITPEAEITFPGGIGHSKYNVYQEVVQLPVLDEYHARHFKFFGLSRETFNKYKEMLTQQPRGPGYDKIMKSFIEVIISHRKTIISQEINRYIAAKGGRRAYPQPNGCWGNFAANPGVFRAERRKRKAGQGDPQSAKLLPKRRKRKAEQGDPPQAIEAARNRPPSDQQTIIALFDPLAKRRRQDGDCRAPTKGL